MKVAVSLPLLIRNDFDQRMYDINMAIDCLSSFENNDDLLLVIINQGCLSDEQLKALLKDFNIHYDIIGTGENSGIPISRQKAFEHVWTNYPDIEYQGEIHLDMLFPKDWHKPIIKYLSEHPEEPMLSPAIINGFNHYSMEPKIPHPVPTGNPKEYIKYLETLKVDKVIPGFVHPVFHNSQILKEIGGIDTRFLRGLQGYEDYCILIGYHYYIGTKNKWYPKVYGMSTVFHGVAQQRWTINKPQHDIAINEEGMFQQYGAKGIKIIADMFNDYEYMGKIYENRCNYFFNAQFNFDNFPDM